MTAKTYTQLIAQANATLADNTSRDISAGDSRNMVIDHLDSQNVGTLVVVAEQGTPLPAAGQAGRLFFETIVSALHVDDGTSFLPVVMTFNARPGPAIVPAANDYSVNQLSDVTLTAPVTDDILVFNGSIFVNQKRNWLENITNDWVPKLSGTGIGSADASPLFVAVGDIGTNTLEGLIAARKDIDGGGISVIGFRGDPQVGTEPNAPVGISGNLIVLDGTLFLSVPDAITVDHFLITKPSLTLPDGREVVPLVIGPEFIPTTQESDSSVADVSITPAATEIDILGGTEGPGLVLANAYTTGTFNISMVIEETGGASALITVTVKLDTGGGPNPVFTDTINLQGNRFNYFVAQPLTGPLSISDILSLHVDYINGQGGGTRIVDVLGSVSPSLLSVQSN